MNAILIKIKSTPVIVLYLIFIIALFIRMFQLGDVPYGLHNDEVANTYAGRYILENGHDIYGNSWPLLYFDKFGDYPPVLPMYLSGLGTYIFGNNEFGSRSLIAIMGGLIIFPAYYLALYLFKRRSTALFTAGVFALSPWHIVLSRLNAEGIMALTVFMIGLTILFRAIQKSNIRILLLSGLCFLSTYLMYPSFRIIVPLALLPSIGFFNFHSKKSKKFITIIGTLIIIAFALTLTISSTHWGKGRFEQTSIVSPISGVGIKLQQLIFNEDDIFIARIFNNKIIGYGREFLFQYSRYFSFNYLFGEDGIPHIYSVPYVGLLFVTILPFILISALSFIQNKNKKTDHVLFSYLFYILLISPIPAALTVLDVPSIHRAILTPALIIFIAAYGFNGLQDLKFKRVPIVLFLFLFICGETIFFVHHYFQNFSYYNTIYRTNGNTEAMQYAFNNRNNYDVIYVTNQEGWLPIYYLFYAKDYNPKYTGKFKYNLRLEHAGNVYFPEEECTAINILNDSIKNKKLTVSKKTLFIQPISCPLFENSFGNSMFRHLKTIKRLDETDVFHIVEINPEFDESVLNSL